MPLEDTLDFGGDGPPLHLAHANGYPPGAYRRLAAALSARYHVTAMVSRPLWPGSSPAGLRSWQPLADDLQAYLEARGARGWVGVGHSLGAVITAEVALRRPELFSAVVLLDPVMLAPLWLAIWNLMRRLGQAHRAHPYISGALKRRRRFDSLAAMVARYRRTPVFSRISDEGLKDFVQAAARPVSGPGPAGPKPSAARAPFAPAPGATGLPRSKRFTPRGEEPASVKAARGSSRRAASARAHSAAGPPVELAYSPEWEVAVYKSGPPNLWPRLGSLKPPLLVIRGAETDTFWPSAVAALRRRLPHAVVKTLPGAGHLVPLEAPDRVAGLILAFLNQHSEINNHQSP
jgi:pimeloyl-ACP methyl ester carboxylesterase